MRKQLIQIANIVRLSLSKPFGPHTLRQAQGDSHTAWRYATPGMLVVAAIFLNTACTEKIDLDLKNSTPELVIEGYINDQPGPYYVALTMSKLYNEDFNFQGVAGATIVMSDDAGNTDTLTDAGIQGLYQTNTIQGVVGRTYHLEVTADGKTYNSYCLMRPPVEIDSIVIEEETGFDGEKRLDCEIQVTDPPGLGNSYRVLSVQEGLLSSGFSVHTDRLWDGKIRNFNIPKDDYKSGDTINVELWSIDEHIYTYFDEFNQNQNNFGAPAAPANPTPVYTPGTLGYFSAHSVKRKSRIVP